MNYLVVSALVIAAVSAAQGKQTFTGVITDDMCTRGGHAQMRMGPTDAECTKICVMVHDAAYVLEDGENIYTLSDQKTPEAFAGQKVNVIGTLDAKTRTIHVDSISAAKWAASAAACCLLTCRHLQTAWRPVNMLVGDPAVPFALPDAGGRLHRLEDYSGHWLLLVFHRHLGWLPCRRHLLQLQQHERTFQELDTRIVVVTFERSPRARAYADETGLGWPILVDETKVLYRAYGMLRGRRRDIWGPRTWWAYTKELFRGRVPRAIDLESDTNQLGGDVLVDPSGTVRFLHVGSGPGDRPSMATLIAARRA
jgi:peroxiredoxin